MREVATASKVSFEDACAAVNPTLIDSSGAPACEGPMSDAPKSFHLSPEIHSYLVRHGTPPDAVQQALIEETQRLGGISMMQIAPEQGAFMTLLARATGAKRAVEVGTFTGYSALCTARGLPEDGRLLCCDVSAEWTAVGRPCWEKAGESH